MGDKSYFSVMLELINGLPPGTEIDDEILSDIGYGSVVPAGYFKTFWLRASSQQEAIETAKSEMRLDAKSLSFIDNESLVVDSVKRCSWWSYIRNKSHSGRTFYSQDTDA